MSNQLKLLDKFKAILADYHVSDASNAVLSKARLALFVAPTAVGRNTIINELIKTGEYHFIVSDTTRQPRVNNGVLEQDGVEYWFRSEEEVLADLEAGAFLEAAIIHNQQVSGISIRELAKASEENNVAVTDIEIVGTDNIVQVKPDTHALFILPPNFEVWMNRLDGRGAMSLDEKRRRMGSAIKEFTAAIDNDYYKFVVNDDFHESVNKVHQIVYEGKESPDQERGRELAKELRSATEAWLYEN